MSLKQKVEEAITRDKEAISAVLLRGQSSYEDYLRGCGHLRGLETALSAFREVWKSAIKDGHTDPDDE